MTGRHRVVLTPDDHAALMSGETVTLATDDGVEFAVAGALIDPDGRAILRQPGQQLTVPVGAGEIVLDTCEVDEQWVDDVFTIRLADLERRRLLHGDTVELEADGGEAFDVSGDELSFEALQVLRDAGIVRVPRPEDLLALDASALDAIG